MGFVCEFLVFFRRSALRPKGRRFFGGECGKVSESERNRTERRGENHEFPQIPGGPGSLPYRNQISFSPGSWLKRLTRSRSISISILNEWTVSARYSIHSRSFQQPMRVCCFFLVLLQVHGCFSSQSFWKAGSARKGSQIGSSLRRAGVMTCP